MNAYYQLLSVIRGRRSVRTFRPEPVRRDDLLRLLEAARWAPSNHNRQPWRFIVLQDRARIAGLADVVRQEVTRTVSTLPALAAAHADDFVRHATLFSEAPLVIVALHRQPVAVGADLLRGAIHPTLVSGEPLSVAMAVQNLLLAASALGLGACVMTAPLVAADAVAATISVPRGCELNCVIALGYPAAVPVAPRRKDIAAIADFPDEHNSTSSADPRSGNP